MFLICAAFSAVSIAQAQDRAGIKETIENRLEKNRDVRNPLIEKKKEMREEAKELRSDMRAEAKLMRASSTDMFKKSAEARKDIREEIKKKMKLNEFNARKNALVKELTVAISNLTNISTRIEARITKAEAEGRVMTDSKALLAIANEKLATAKIEVAAFQALSIDSSATASSTETSATAEVDLIKPRTLGDAAIKSVKEAKEAFQKVIVSIAHNMEAEVKSSSEVETNQ